MSQPETSYKASDSESAVDWEDSKILPDESEFIELNIINLAPTISANLVNTINVGENYFVKLNVIDEELDPLTYTVNELPKWLSFNENTLELSGLVSINHVGFYEDISIEVSDGTSSNVLGPFSIVVTNTNFKLEMSGTPIVEIGENAFYQFLPSIKNVAQNPLTFTIFNKPSWALFNQNNGKLSGTPDFTDAKIYSNVLITVTDGASYTAIAPFTITVKNLNRAPQIQGQNLSVFEDSKVEFSIVASDADLEPINWSLVSPAGFGVLEFINLGNNLFTYKPNADYFGVDQFTLMVTDQYGENAQADFTVNVTSLNDIPQANPDIAYAEKGVSQKVYVLSNDKGLGDVNPAIKIEISSPPSQGSVTINADGSLNYIANDNAEALDSFVYKITDANNDTSLASVSVNIRGSCTLGCTKLVNINWDQSISAYVSGYYLYYGQFSGQYDEVIWLGDVTTFEHEIVTYGGPHFYAIKTMNTLGDLSDFSKEFDLIF